MDSETNYDNNAFMEVAINKMEKQDQRMNNIEVLIQKQINNNAEIKQLATAVESLKQSIKDSSISDKSITALITQTDTLITKLNTTPVHKILHHHYVPKIVWATAALMITICIVCSGWYYTGKKLGSFIANDTKYRALRLDTSQRFLQQYLDYIDSVYNKNPDMRNVVIQKEKEFETNFYRMQKAMQLKEEAKRLERAAGKK
jgi:hypothetical protein